MNESKATRYQRLHRRARAAAVGSAVLMLATVALTPLSHVLSRLAEGFASGLSQGPAAVVSLTLFVVLVVAVWEVASLPAVFYFARRLDTPYGQGTPSVEDVLGGHLQSAVVALVAGLGAGGAVALAVAAVGVWWWLVAGPLLAALLAVALHVGPAVFRVLGAIRPLDRPSLASRVAALALRAGAPVAGIEEWVVDETTGATALVTGVGRSRRVLVSSAIARRWPEDEVEVIVAHELAHHVHRDLWRAFGLHVVVLWGALFAADLALRSVGPRLGLGGPEDRAALPLIALVTIGIWVASAPLRHAQSRRHERRADAFALSMTDAVDAFDAAVTRLGARHLAEERPSRLTRWLYYRHPPVAERRALAEAFRRARRGAATSDRR